MKYNNPATARAYENYKTIQAFKRQTNTTDDDVFGLLNNTNLEVLDENSNKNGHVVSTQRDLIAGEVSKDIARRKLIPADIVQAHDSGAIHFHDMDYIIQPMFNCCLINLEDMLANGTVINGKKIDTPKSFQVACTVTTQIIAQVASGQYGGQSNGQSGDSFGSWPFGFGFGGSIIFCMLFPNGQDLRPTDFQQNDCFIWLVKRIYAADTNTNVFPSMHVIGSAALVAAALHTPSLRKRRLHLVAIPVGVLICISTVFVKQHSCLDLIGAIPYALLWWLIYGVIYKKRKKA